MTKKDYIIVAKVLAGMNPYNECEKAFKQDLINRLSASFKLDNARYDEIKFGLACMSVQEKSKFINN